jgi:hypothetical protein
MINKALKVIGVGALAYVIYLYYKKKNQPIVVEPTPTPTRTKAEETKAALKKEGAKLIEPYYDSEAGKAAERRFKSRTSANTELLFSGKKQYVTLENLIPNQYDMYNNFSGKYNHLNVENTTNIDDAERTQAIYIRPKPLFNNAR